jgi:exopolysaccharide biosynthesis polyprenyl glycosylphosphotransferase
VERGTIRRFEGGGRDGVATVSPRAHAGVAELEPLPARPALPRRTRLSHWLLEGRGWTWLRLSVDSVMAEVAVITAIAGATQAGVSRDGQAAIMVLPILVIASLWSRGLYKRRVRLVVLDNVGPLVGAISVAAMVIVAFEMFAEPDAQPGPLIARAWFFTLIYVGSGRALLAMSQRRARALGHVGRATLILGAGVVGELVARRLDEHPEYGLRPIGFLDPDPLTEPIPGSRRLPVLGTPDDLAAVVADTGAEHVILAFSSAPDRGLVTFTRDCEHLGLEVSLVPRLFESITNRMALERLGGLPLFGLRAVDPKGWQFALKYTFDRALAAIALVLVGPLLGAIALAVKASSPGPVFFRQRRVGRNGHVFDLFKFRSMRPPRPEDSKFRPSTGSAPGGVEGLDRRTPIGRFLRRTSLDELPQLLNVLRGDMSMVGPRPERPEYVELFEQDFDRYADRHRVKSGITGWAQVHGLRGQTSLADRVEWDNYYIENFSFWLDVKILLLTVLAVFRSAE